MGGTCLAQPRWHADPFYRERIVRGRVLDIGPGLDPLALYATHYPEAESFTCLDHMPSYCCTADWLTADAETGLDVLGDRTFDLVFSSHCLEHVHDPSAALRAWWDRVAPGGHLVVIVPSWTHYERCVWPPAQNTDHKTAWVLDLQSAVCAPFLRGIVGEVHALGGTLIRAVTLDAGFNPHDTEDQTRLGTCECGHEVVVWKPA